MRGKEKGVCSSSGGGGRVPLRLPASLGAGRWSEVGWFSEEEQRKHGEGVQRQFGREKNES